MIEISYAEMFLMGWAGFATVAYMYARRELSLLKQFIFVLMDDDELREDMVAQHKSMVQNEAK